MRKRIVMLLAAAMVVSAAGCSGDEENKKTEESSIETTVEEESLTTEIATEESSTVEETTTVVEEEVSSSEETTNIVEETTTKENKTEKQTTTQQQTTTVQQTTTQKPTEKPVETTTQKPEEVEAPIVQKIGSVDEALYNKAVKAFEGIVKKMRTDGIVKKSDVCVTMEGQNITVDINYKDEGFDYKLVYDGNTKTYQFIIDTNCWWLPDVDPATIINGKESASYNLELIKAVLSMTTNDVESLFYRIDMDCFSAMGLEADKWVQIGDCSIKPGPWQEGKSFSYYITKEDVDSRDKTFTLVGKNSEGKTVECILEYESSMVTYEAVDTGAYMEGNDSNNIFGYPTIKTGCSSYENYKKGLIENWKAKGDPNAKIYEMTSHSANGYTYYWFELFYETADAKGDPEILYVQIGPNEYLELYGFESWIRFEDFINGALFIKEVKVK